MMHFPLELVIADGINAVFITLGSVFLLKFFLRFGSEKSKNISLVMVCVLIAYTILHEGNEIFYGFNGFQIWGYVPFVVIGFAVVYLITSFLLRNEVRSLLFIGGRKHGK